MNGDLVIIERPPVVETCSVILIGDAVTTVGLERVLRLNHIVALTVSADAAIRLASARWDYVLLLPWEPAEADHYAILDRIHILAGAMPQATFFAITPRTPNRYLALRLAESGVQFATSYCTLLGRLSTVIGGLQEGALPQEWQLGTPFAQRQELGLLALGDLPSFLRSAGQIPRRVWEDDRAYHESGVARSAVNRARRSALVLGGIPPSPRVFTGAVRRPPTLPTWPVVKDVVLAAWGDDQG